MAIRGFNIRGAGNGGTGTDAFDGKADLFSELPDATEHPLELWIVLESSGVYFVNRREKGLYHSDGVEWKRLGDIPGFIAAHNDSDEAHGMTATGRALLRAADAAAGRGAIELGDAATADIGTTTGTVAAGDHLHDDVYEPADATILRGSNIGTATGEVIGVDEARDYFGLDYETSVLPTISSDFSRNKHELYEQYGNEPKTILQMWTTARDTNGTYRDAAGVIRTAGPAEPRIDYDPVTGRAALLAEEARTRLNTHPTDFDDAAWSKIRASVTANATTAPDGAMSGDKLVENTEGGSHLVGGTGIAVTAGVTYTNSVFVKAAERSKGRIRLRTTETFGNAVFDLEAGTISNGSIISVGNGWYRITVAGTATVSSSTANMEIFLYDDFHNESYTGDGASGYYIWGAQVEVGNTSSSIILDDPESQAHRAADLPSRNLGDEFNPREGTLFIEYMIPAFSGNVFAVAAGANTTNYMGVYNVSSGQARTIFFVVGGVSLNTVISGVPYGQTVKIAISYKAGEQYVVSSNGVETVSADPLPDDLSSLAGQLDIGARFGSFITAEQYTKRFRYIPMALSAAELQEMTKL